MSLVFFVPLLLLSPNEQDPIQGAIDLFDVESVFENFFDDLEQIKGVKVLRGLFHQVLDR